MNKIKKILAATATLFMIGSAVGCNVKPLELAAPTIALNDNVVTWNAVDKAEGYIVSLNSEESQVTGTSYTINATGFGDYTVKVKAFAKDKETLIYSNYSNTVTYHKDLKLSAPVITLTGSKVTWPAVANASKYEVFVNGTSKGEQAELAYTVNETAYGDYKVTVKAIGMDGSKKVTSDASNEKTYHVALVLDAPVIAIEGKVVSWAAVTNATKYEVFVNGTSKGEQEGREYTINETAFGDYKVTVKAVGMDGTNKVVSAASNEVKYHVDLVLTAPVIALNENVVSWTAVANATKYEVFVNGTTKGEQTALSYTMNETAHGDYKVTVKAIGMDGSRKVTSAASNEVTYHKDLVLAAPTITLSQNVVSWTAVANATQYEVFVNGNSKGKQEGLSYTISESAHGDYAVKVKAVGMDGTTEVKSDFSNEVSYHVALVLDAPAITLSQNVVSWNEVTNATKYEVFVNGDSKGEQTTCSYTINDSAICDYKITVKAIGMDGATKVTSAASNEVRYVTGEELISSKNVAYDNIPLEWSGAGVTWQGYHMCTNAADTYSIETKAPLLVSEKIFKFTALTLGHINDFKVYAKTAGAEYVAVGNTASIPNDGNTHQFCFDFSEYIGKLVSIKIEAIKTAPEYISVAIQSIGFVQESTKITDISSWEVGDIYQDWDFDGIGMSKPSGYDYGVPMPKTGQSISNKIKLGNNQTAIRVNADGKNQNLTMYVNDVESTLPKTVDEKGVIYNLTAYAGQEITVKFVATSDISIPSIELISMPNSWNYYSFISIWTGGNPTNRGYHLCNSSEATIQTTKPVLVTGKTFRLSALGWDHKNSLKVYVKTAEGDFTLIRANGASKDEVVLPETYKQCQYSYDFSNYLGQNVTIKIVCGLAEASYVSTAIAAMGFASDANKNSWNYSEVFVDWEYSAINTVTGDPADYPCIISGQEISKKINVTSEYNAIKVVGVAPQLLTLYVNGVESTASKVYDSNACYYNLADYVGQEVTVKFAGQNATIYSMSLDKMPTSWNYDTFASTWEGAGAAGQGLHLCNSSDVTVQTTKPVLVTGKTFRLSALSPDHYNSLKVYVKAAEGDFTLIRAIGASEDEVVLPEFQKEFQYSYDFSNYLGQNVTIKIVCGIAKDTYVSTFLTAMGFASDANKSSWNYGEVFVDWSFDTCMLAGSETQGDPRCYLVLDANQTMTKTVKVTREHHLLKIPETANVSLTVNGVDVGFVNINGFDVFDLSNYIGCEVNLVIKGVSYSRIISINLA